MQHPDMQVNRYKDSNDNLTPSKQHDHKRIRDMGDSFAAVSSSDSDSSDMDPGGL